MILRLILGYTAMVAAFLLVYFGIRSYRDSVGGGRISFGRALAVGALITAVASVCYTATWEVLYFKVMPGFGAKYAQYALDQARAQGKSAAELAKLSAEEEQFVESYKNPAYNSAITFLEPLPVGLMITLVSAGVLRRKRREEAPLLTPA